MKRFSSKIPPELRVYHRKIDKILELERKYWKEISKHLDYLSDIDPEKGHRLEEFFPKGVSSRIYACLDGVALVRYRIPSQFSKFEIFYSKEKLEIFLKALPVPTISGELLLPFAPGGDVRIIKSFVKNHIVDWLHVSSFYYKDLSSELAEFEEALTDLRVYMIGLFIDQDFKPIVDSVNSKVDEKKSVILQLNNLIAEFEDLLNTAKREEEIQQFLTKYPILIQPYTKVFPKYKLGKDFIPDFVLVNELDQRAKYTFIEIESADMKIFTKNGEFSSKFSHAFKQTQDWRMWLRRYRTCIEDDLPGLIEPNFLIIGGRSVGLSKEERNRIDDWNTGNNDTKFLTYDDLLERAKELVKSLEETVTIKQTKEEDKKS